MSNNRNERANKNQGRHESSQQSPMNDKDRLPKPVENANGGKESQAENAPMPKHEVRDSSSKDVAHGRPGAQNMQNQALTDDRSQAGQVDKEHDGSSHDDKPSQPGKPAAKDTPGPVDKPSQPTKEDKPAKPRKAKNHDSFYLGLASAVLVASSPCLLPPFSSESASGSSPMQALSLPANQREREQMRTGTPGR